MRYFLVPLLVSGLALAGCDKPGQPNNNFEDNVISESQSERVRKVCRAVVLDLLRLESTPIIGFKPMKICRKSKFGVEIGFDAGTGQTIEAIVMLNPYRIFLSTDGKSRGICHKINEKERLENEILRNCMQL